MSNNRLMIYQNQLMIYQNLLMIYQNLLIIYQSVLMMSSHRGGHSMPACGSMCCWVLPQYAVFCIDLLLCVLFGFDMCVCLLCPCVCVCE